MARTGGDKTRQRILAAAEKLFASKGFDATSVDQIARAAKVNKALIYYHFKSKDDLVLRLLENIVEEVGTYVEQQTRASAHPGGRTPEREIQEEVAFMVERQNIISVMLVEALRSHAHNDFLFRCAELVMTDAHMGKRPEQGRPGSSDKARQLLVHDFFTGFIPLMAFAALRDRWCEHFGLSPEKVTTDFVAAFMRSHIATAPKGHT